MHKRLLILVSLFLLTACTAEEQQSSVEDDSDKLEVYDYTFEGSGESWRGELMTKGTQTWKKAGTGMTYFHENEEEFRLLFQHETQDVADGTEIIYSFKTRTSSGEGYTVYDSTFRDGVILHRTTSEGAARLQPEEIIQVNVEWLDQKESFELTLPSQQE